MEIQNHLALPPRSLFKTNLAEIDIFINVCVWSATVSNIAVSLHFLKFLKQNSLRLNCILMFWLARLKCHFLMYSIFVWLSLIVVLRLAFDRRLDVHKWILRRSNFVWLLKLIYTNHFFWWAVNFLHCASLAPFYSTVPHLCIESFVGNTVTKNIERWLTALTLRLEFMRHLNLSYTVVSLSSTLD